MPMKRKIPKLAVAALTLAGCGEQSDTQVLKSAYRDYCKMEKQCEPEDFERFYETVDQCTEYWTSYRLDQFSDSSSECVKSYAQLLRCATDLKCDDDEDSYACEVEYDETDELCGDAFDD